MAHRSGYSRGVGSTPDPLVSACHAHPLTHGPQVWIQPGFGLADDYLAGLEAFSGNNPEATVLLILFVFAIFHSGMAALRPYGGWVGP